MQKFFNLISIYLKFKNNIMNKCLTLFLFYIFYGKSYFYIWSIYYYPTSPKNIITTKWLIIATVLELLLLYFM